MHCENLQKLPSSRSCSIVERFARPFMSEAVAAIRNLIYGAAPERRAELAELWDQYAPAVEVVPDQTGTLINANKRRIRFDLKTLDALWLIGFSGWRAIETYAPQVVVATITQTSIQSVMRDDEELGQFEQDYKHRLRLAQDLIASDGKTAVQWPPDIPRPTADRAYLRDDQEQVPFDLTLMAVAYVFLHELRHVILDHDDVHASSAAEEEIACDVWARGMLLDKLANYAQKHGLSYEAVLNKRATAMALACLMLQTITPHWAQWGNDDYPSVGERMAALIKDVTLSSGSGFWIVAASVLVGVMRETHQSIEVVPSSVAELVNDLIERRR